MDPQKASRTEERFATVRITTVMPTGINSMFIQDLPVAIKSPINTPQKIQGTSSAIAKVILIFSKSRVRINLNNSFHCNVCKVSSDHYYFSLVK
jgi:hypothetical protein